ncbi:hypothetical protein H9623_12475 [Oerskovia sp. Sa1BUA8]|uniref:PH domain-containing protein n=1 Tax=Oerskovia douganii TaxID=2762210 RepID=A0A9D5UAG0_9CELL|nr:hypothetical protein [Oerskovia douganii]MBE7701113.1 hypothetical protein [Oerskovia douganii]
MQEKRSSLNKRREVRLRNSGPNFAAPVAILVAVASWVALHGLAQKIGWALAGAALIYLIIQERTSYLALSDGELRKVFLGREARIFQLDDIEHIAQHRVPYSVDSLDISWHGGLEQIWVNPAAESLLLAFGEKLREKSLAGVVDESARAALGLD